VKNKDKNPAFVRRVSGIVSHNSIIFNCFELYDFKVKFLLMPTALPFISSTNQFLFLVLFYFTVNVFCGR
jgi:hypothetical protein